MCWPSPRSLWLLPGLNYHLREGRAGALPRQQGCKLDQLDCVVVGAGVVGLAVARALALGGREVLVLESADRIGTGTSSRNSEVIHAGIYYPAASLKGSLCVRGRDMLYAYCAARGIGHRRCGKLIVATEVTQLDALAQLWRQAIANGAGELQPLTRQQARQLEPQLRCEAALLSPQTGIVDSHGLMLSLQGDLQHARGEIAFNSPLAHMQYRQGAIVLKMTDGTVVASKSLVNAAGLNALTLAASCRALDPQQLPQAFYAKGSYFTLAGRSPFSRLVYPVPEPGGLGVHLTLDLGGQAKFGPDVQWVDSPEDLAVDPARGQRFYAEVRRYWPDLQEGTLQPGYAGIRPKISGPGSPAADFVIAGPASHGVPGLVNLFGIESPGLTASLAIGEHVAALLAR